MVRKGKKYIKKDSATTHAPPHYPHHPIPLHPKVPNAVLASWAIENFRRSPAAVFRIELHFSLATTAAQLEQLRRRLNAYLARATLDWRPTCTIRFVGIQNQSMAVTVWLSSHHTWQQVSPLFRAVFEAYVCLVSILREVRITFRAPDQSLHVMLQQQQAAAAQQAPQGLLPTAGGGRGGAAPTEGAARRADERSGGVVVALKVWFSTASRNPGA